MLSRVLLFVIPMDCSPLGPFVHGILQARILEWVAMPFSRRIFPTQGSKGTTREVLKHIYMFLSVSSRCIELSVASFGYLNFDHLVKLYYNKLSFLFEPTKMA